MAQTMDNSQKVKIAFAVVTILIGVCLILFNFDVIPNPFASKPVPPKISEEQKKDFDKQEQKAKEEAKTKPPSGA